MLKANAWRAVKHAGHHEGLACRGAARLLLLLRAFTTLPPAAESKICYGAEKGSEWKHGPFCSHLSSVTAAASRGVLGWARNGEGRGEGWREMGRELILSHGVPSLVVCGLVVCGQDCIFFFSFGFLEGKR